MKKYGLSTIVCVVFALIFTACDKEGVYNPKQKISKIYAQYYYDLEEITPPKELAETWIWDKNLLVKIVYEAEDQSYDIFEYDGKQISKIKNYYDGEQEGYLTFTYEKSTLKKIEYFYESTLCLSAEITHDGKKISKVKMTEYYDDIEEEVGEEEYAVKNLTHKDKAFNLIHLFIPGQKKHFLYKNLHKSETYNYTITYVYDGDNIISEKWIYEDATDFTTYTYDDKLSPYYNFINYAESLATSKNNILTMKQQFSYEGESDEFTGTFTYEYDGKWPVKSTGEYKSEGEHVFTDVYYYEYLK